MHDLAVILFKLSSIYFQAQQREKSNNENAFWEYSSLIWVCSSNEHRSFVTIFDGNNPNNILECFNACDAHILCVASVQGVRKSDYPNDDQHTNLIRDGGYLEQMPNDIASEKEQFGAVQWVPVRRDSDEPPTYISIDEKASPKRERNCRKSLASPSFISKFVVSVSNTPPDKSLESADEIGKSFAVFQTNLNHDTLQLPRASKMRLQVHSVPLDLTSPSRWSRRP